MAAKPIATSSSFFPSNKPSLSKPTINTTNPSLSKPTINLPLKPPPIKAVQKTEEYYTPPPNNNNNYTLPPKTFYNQLPDWSVLLAAITTIFLAAEKQWILLDSKPKFKPDLLTDAFAFGRIMEDGLIFRQNFLIRSYEIGADKTASIETLMNHLQETALNHVRCAGLMGDGFGSTPEMSKKNLIWVVSKMKVFIDKYPSWGDMVEIDTWAGPFGKNGMSREWHIRDYNTGQTILRATSLWVMMNKLTRKLAKIPEEVRNEIEPYFVERKSIIEEDNRKFSKLEGLNGCNAEKHLRKGLRPRWSDLDVNQHVNNVKYIGWILESAPMSILENHELSYLNLEYRRECNKDSVVQSLTTVYSDSVSVHCEHNLSLESGPNIVKARSAWRPKKAQVEQVEIEKVVVDEVAPVGV